MAEVGVGFGEVGVGFGEVGVGYKVEAVCGRKDGLVGVAWAGRHHLGEGTRLGMQLRVGQCLVEVYLAAAVPVGK